MNSKEYLQQLQRFDTIINQKLLEKADLRASLTMISSPDLTRERVQGGHSPHDSGFAKKVAKVLDLEAEIDRDSLAYVELRHKIIGQIHGLKDVKHIKLLYKRYVEFKRLEMIADELNYTYQYTKELHGGALQEFETTYPNIRADVL